MKHAISKNEKGGIIEIRAGINQDRLIIEISDSGADQESKKSQTEHEAGIGLENTEQRLSVLYENDYQINTMRRAEGGRSTCINMPLELSDTK
jgi:sensor histidine kinase YesM